MVLGDFGSLGEGMWVLQECDKVFTDGFRSHLGGFGGDLWIDDRRNCSRCGLRCGIRCGCWGDLSASVYIGFGLAILLDDGIEVGCGSIN